MKHALRSRFSLALLLGLALPLTAAFLSSPGEAAGAPAGANRYIGASKCKNCHSSEDTGDQYGKWSAMNHAKAFDLLASPEAMEVGKKVGVAEPQKADACLKCHVTAHGEPEDMIKKGFKAEQGVSCETCHGPGEEHMGARMKAAMSGEDDPTKYDATPAGEVVTDPGAATCLRCHNDESPTFTGFCYFEAKKTISHRNPMKPHPEEEMVCACGKHDEPGHVCTPESGCAKPAGATKEAGAQKEGGGEGDGE